MSQENTENEVLAVQSAQDSFERVVLPSNGRVKWLIYVFFTMTLLALIFLAIQFVYLSREITNLERQSAKLSTLVSTSGGTESPATRDSGLDVSANAAENLKLKELAKKMSELTSKVNTLAFIEVAATHSQSLVEKTVSKNNTPPVNAEIKWWRAVGEQVLTPILNVFKDLVKVQIIDDPQMRSAAVGLAVGPAAQSLVRQELRIYLLSARQQTLLGMPKEALDELTEARLIATKNFAVTNLDVVNFLLGLDQVEVDLKKITTVSKSELAKNPRNK